MAGDDCQSIPGGTETVLVMDGDPSDADRVSQVLGGLGYRILRAETPAHALRTAREEPVHLLLLDMGLSMVGGLELAHAISTVRPGAKVLYLSGIADPEALGDREGRHYLMGFLDRPFTARDLGHKVRDLLDSRFPRPLPWTLSPGAVPNVLVVDDDEGLRKTAARLLARMGYDVHEASDPNQAIRVVLAEPLDLIIMDVVLPRLNGLALAHTLSALRPGVRMLYMSGYSRDELRGHFGLPDPGGVAFLQKPFNPEGLASIVAGMIGDPLLPPAGVFH